MPSFSSKDPQITSGALAALSLFEEAVVRRRTAENQAKTDRLKQLEVAHLELDNRLKAIAFPQADEQPSETKADLEEAIRRAEDERARKRAPLEREQACLLADADRQRKEELKLIGHETLIGEGVKRGAEVIIGARTPQESKSMSALEQAREEERHLRQRLDAILARAERSMFIAGLARSFEWRTVERKPRFSNNSPAHWLHREMDLLDDSVKRLASLCERYRERRAFTRKVWIVVSVAAAISLLFLFLVSR